MTDTSTLDTRPDDHVIPAARLEGVRRGRVYSFLVDYLVIAVLCIPAAIVVAILGIPTLGLAWGLFPFLIPIIAVVYVAMTLGGEKQATLGMRMNGLKVVKLGGGKVDPILAGLHHILFLFIQGFGVFLPLVISLFSDKKRLLHDILLGTYIARG